MTDRRIRKGIYYFRSHEAAQAFAVMGNWPTDRIIRYELGYAIQIHCSGPYVGPASAGDRRHLELCAALARV